MPTLGLQIVMVLLIAVPVSCVAWTVTHEEVFREVHDFCVKKSKSSKHLVQRKFFYLFTCEYCFSHYVTILALFMTHFRLLMPDWRGYVLAGFSIVWIANIYMSLFARLRLDIKHEREEIAVVEKVLEVQNGAGTAAAADKAKDDRRRIARA